MSQRHGRWYVNQKTLEMYLSRKHVWWCMNKKLIKHMFQWDMCDDVHETWLVMVEQKTWWNVSVQETCGMMVEEKTFGNKSIRKHEWWCLNKKLFGNKSIQKTWMMMFEQKTDQTTVDVRHMWWCSWDRCDDVWTNKYEPHLSKETCVMMFESTTGEICVYPWDSGIMFKRHVDGWLNRIADKTHVFKRHVGGCLETWEILFKQKGWNFVCNIFIYPGNMYEGVLKIYVIMFKHKQLDITGYIINS